MPISVQAISISFRFLCTGSIFKLDTRGVFPNSDSLKKVNTVEFTTKISGFLIVDESVRVIRYVDPFFVNIQVKKWSDVEHVTSRLSPA